MKRLSARQDQCGLFAADVICALAHFLSQLFGTARCVRISEIEQLQW